jgi:release factor glutamine methyltransferase
VALDAVTMSWRQLRAEIAHALAAAGIEHAETEARFIIEESSGSTASEWHELAMAMVPARAVAHVREMCGRRVRGEPLQYALGAWSFRGLDLMVDARVLIPRPETEWVVEVALEEAERLGLRRVRKRPAIDAVTRVIAADLGTGSGAIALALEHELPEVAVWATDVSEAALDVASANAAGCGATRVRVAAGSWFAALPDELRGRLTIVVSNPPYVAEHEVAALPDEVARFEPRHALVPGPTGMEAIIDLIDQAPAWMAERATFVCEIAPHQADAVVARAFAAGYDDAFVRADLTGRPRVLVARRG